MHHLVRRVVRPDVSGTQVVVAQQRGVTVAAHIHGGAFATLTALHNATMLSRAAEAAHRASPAGDEVYEKILTAYGNFAAAEIRQLSTPARARER